MNLNQYEYMRIDDFRLISLGIRAKWLHSLPDVEYREDYSCFFVLKGSKSHTLIAIKFGDIFE
jgi:hypothetical protein